MKRVIVIGAGPAGLTAATAAAEAGADVVLIDEGERVGGQFWRHHPQFTDRRMQHQHRRFEQLNRALDAVRVLTSTSVWRIETEGGLRVHVLTGPADAAGRVGESLDADAIVIATGAHDRVLPVPGWTLPGVTSAGAVQALAKRDGVALGTRMVVAGAGPFLLPVAQSAALLGVNVAEVVEATAFSAVMRGWARRPWELAAAAGKAGELASYASSLVAHRTAYRFASAVTRIHGTTAVEAVTVQRVDATWRPIAETQRTVECDAVALGHGFTPRLEAAIQAGCEISPDRFVRVDEYQRTTTAGVYAAGEITGIGGADAALAEGEIAGLAAAGAMGAGKRWKRAVKKRAQMTAFATRLATHAIGSGWVTWLDDDTVVCRCEGTTRAAIAEFSGASTRAQRLATRAGLGPCQGRTCGRNVDDLAGTSTGIDRRPVLASVRIGELAALNNTPEREQQ